MAPTVRSAKTSALSHASRRAERSGCTTVRAGRRSRLSATFTRPDGFDAHAHLIRTLASTWSGWTAEVLLDVPVEVAKRWVSPIVGSIEETPEGPLLRTQANSLDWMAQYLAGLPCRFVVRQPPELLDALRRLRARLDRCVRESAGG